MEDPIQTERLSPLDKVLCSADLFSVKRSISSKRTKASMRRLERTCATPIIVITRTIRLTGSRRKFGKNPTTASPITTATIGKTNELLRPLALSHKARRVRSESRRTLAYASNYSSLRLATSSLERFIGIFDFLSECVCNPRRNGSQNSKPRNVAVEHSVLLEEFLFKDLPFLWMALRSRQSQ